MTTLKLAVVPAKVLKSGKHKIRIAIGHKQETRYLVTRFVIDSPSQFRDGQVVDAPYASHINMKLRNLLNTYQEALDKINTNFYTCSQIAEYLSNYREGTCPFTDIANEYIGGMIKEGRKSTAQLYQKTTDYFLDSVGHDSMLEGITPRTIKDFDLYLKQRNFSPATRGTHMAHLKAIINYAIKYRKVSYEAHPFEFYEKPDCSVRELDISVDEVRLIRDAEVTEKSLCMARDLFMLSYYLGGINLIDLMQINFKGKDTIEYIREKSKNTKKGDKKISFTIPDEAKPIIKKWMGKNGKLNFGYKLS